MAGKGCSALKAIRIGSGRLSEGLRFAGLFSSTHQAFSQPERRGRLTPFSTIPPTNFDVQ